ncbi:MAG: hypothetical protein RBU45_06800 [Myxococcota bacterium]|jgi:hypothetical protein|nr:hypothetical protein [Myxococcota bacterium]
MNQHWLRHTLGWAVPLAPPVALLLSWLAMGWKTAHAGIPGLWWLALLTLPAFAVVVAAGVHTLRQHGGPRPDRAPTPPAPTSPARPDS